METYLPIFIGILGLLVSMWSIVIQKSKNAVKVFAWCAIIAATLIIPIMIVIWASMQVSATIFAPTTTNLSDFVSQVGWTIGAFSASYTLIWGVRFFPRLEKYVSDLFPDSNDNQEKANTISKNSKGGKS